MEKSSTQCTIDVTYLLTMICNEKLLSSSASKIIMKKEAFLKHNVISGIANRRSRLSATLQPQ